MDFKILYPSLANCKWRTAQSPIMVTTITLQRLMQKGYESMLSYYERVSLQFSEPLYLPAGRRVRGPVRIRQLAEEAYLTAYKW